jgi:hypothetical protein
MVRGYDTRVPQLWNVYILDLELMCVDQDDANIVPSST